MATVGARPPKSKPAAVVTETELRQQSQDLGTLGAIFGSKDNAPIYMAGILAVISLLGAILVGTFAPTFPEKGDLVKSLVAVVISALSFIGGASGRGR